MNESSRTIRAFIAIPLPEPLRMELLGVQADLKGLLCRRSTAFPRRENLHVTLRFLGELDAVRVPEIAAKVRSVLRGFGSLELYCERLGCFPSLRFPKVVWAWVNDRTDRLPELVRRVNSAVAGSTVEPEEARFVGHVTLARPRQITRAEAQRLAAFVDGAVTRQFGFWTCPEVVLYRSELGRAGRSYTPLDTFALGV